MTRKWRDIGRKARYKLSLMRFHQGLVHVPSYKMAFPTGNIKLYVSDFICLFGSFFWRVLRAYAKFNNGAGDSE